MKRLAHEPLRQRKVTYPQSTSRGGSTNFIKQPMQIRAQVRVLLCHTRERASQFGAIANERHGRAADARQHHATDSVLSLLKLTVVLLDLVYM